MGARSQRKGRGGELELSRVLQGYGFPVKPGQAESFGAVPDLEGLPGIHVECKRTEQQRMLEWIEQARHDAEKFHDGLPAVFWRKNRCPWLVTMRLEDWLELYQRGRNPKMSGFDR